MINLQYICDGTANSATYPFSLNIIKNLHEIEFPTQITFFVGENGTENLRYWKPLRSNLGLELKVEAKILTS